MKKSEIVKLISKLMNEHNAELDNLKNVYNKETEKVKKEIKDLENGSNDKEFVKDYQYFAGVLKSIINELKNIVNSFPLDQYKKDLEKIVNSSKPRVYLNKKSNTDDWVNLIQNEAIDFVQKISACSDYNNLIKLISGLYQDYVDACYIDSNALSLIKESKIYNRELKKLIDVKNNKLADLTNKYAEDTKEENLIVYNDIVNTRDEISQIRNTEKDYRFANGTIEFGNGYNDYFLLGTRETEPISSDAIKYAKKYLNDNLQGFTSEKVEWHIDGNHGSLIIDLPKKILCERTASKFYEYIELLLFSFIKGLPIKKVQFAAINCPAPDVPSISSPFVPIIQRAEKKLGETILYHSIGRDKDEAEKIIHSLYVEGQNRSDTYFSDGYENIYDYNEKTIDNQHDFKFLIINNYPYGFEDKDVVNKLQSLIKSNDTGIITIIFQCSENSIYEEKKTTYSEETVYTYLDYKTLQSDYLHDFNFANKTFYFNDKLCSFDIEQEKFDHMQYWNDILDGYQNANILYIEQLLKQAEKKDKKYSVYDSKLKFPIGKCNGDIYDFSINVKSDSSALILGSTGSGKSSLLHVIILSAAYFYSPRELSICLVDFKGKDDSTEFNVYKKGNKLYIPHINYLSLKSTTENALDMLDMLETMHNNRMKVLSKKDVPNIVEYNNLPEVKNNPKLILPRVLFIIDEFNTMLQGGIGGIGNNDFKNQSLIKKRIELILKLVRASGITVIFSGQGANDLNEEHLNQIKIRVALKGYGGSIINYAISENIQEYEAVLNEKGKSIISTDAGFSKQQVSLAYSGEMGSSRQIALAESIREKYASIDNEFSQVIAGSTELMPVTEMKNLDELILQEEKLDSDSYSVYFGVTSTSSLPVAIRFTNEKSSMNYLMRAETNRLSTYECNAIIGFINTLFVRKKLPNNTCVSYIRINEGTRYSENKLLPYLDYPLIKNAVLNVDEEKEACNEILAVYDIYQKRAKKIDKDHSPYLLVLHNTSWLTNLDWLDEDTSLKFDANIGDDISDIASLDLDTMTNHPEKINFGNSQSDGNKNEGRSLDVDKVKNALYTLYSNGYIYNIFVIIASPLNVDLKEFISKTNRDNEAYNYTICDSFTFDNSNEKYPATCCHINSTRLVEDIDEKVNVNINIKQISSKTRLFDYSLTSEKEFFKKFMGGKKC